MTQALLDSLRRRLGSPDPVVRSAVLEVLREMRAADAGPFAAALSDADHRVRLRAVRGLVSTGEAPPAWRGRPQTARVRYASPSLTGWRR